MRRALEAFARGEDAASASWSEGSKGNGAAVRVVPIACAYHDDVVALAENAEKSAQTTNSHSLGRASTVAHAIALASALRSNDAIDERHLRASFREAPCVANTAIAESLERALDLAARGADFATAAQDLGTGVLAEESVPFALFSFLRWAPDFESVVTQLGTRSLAGGDA